jgi:hypothetical protein
MTIFVVTTFLLSQYGQRHQSHQSGARRKEENEQVVGRTTWLCANYCLKVVYQRLSASDGDVSTNSEVVGGRIERISE